MTSTAQALLQTAMQGGPGTQAFFSNQIPTNNFFQWMQEMGDAAWIWTVDESTGYPAFFSAQQSGENELYLEGTVTVDAAAVSDPASAAQFTWNGQSYHVVGMITGTLGYNVTPLWYTTVPVGLALTFPAGYLGTIVWANALKPLIVGAWSGIKSCIGRSAEAEDFQLMEDGAADGADAAAVDAVPAGEDTISLAAAGGAFAGMAVLVAVPIVIGALSHNSYHQLQVYNLTDYDLVWSLAHQDSGTMSMEPVSGQGDMAPDYTIQAARSIAPPGLQPVMVVSDATFCYANTNALEGFGYVLQFSLNVAGTTTQVDTAAVMFVVPLEGANSVFAATGDIGSAQSWYENNEYLAANQQTQSVASDATVVVTATFDYLTGQHPGPSGQDGYYYNSILVFAPPAP